MSDTPQSQKCYDYLIERNAAGSFSTDDLIAVMHPLMLQVQACHDRGLVAPLDGLNHLYVNYSHIYFEDHDQKEPKLNQQKLDQLQQQIKSTFEIVSEVNETLDIDAGLVERQELNIDEDNSDDLNSPVYLASYRSWEQTVGHHDALTDIYSLGMLLASFALRLDLGDKEQLKRFVNHRQNLFLINEHIHPVVASMIVSMTELNRRERVQDLPSLIQSLKNYRNQDLAQDVDYSDYEGFKEASVEGKREIIQSYLCKKLFEISKRNRLLYYRETLSHLNLTQASVPIMLDYKNIAAEQLFLWHPELQKLLFSKKGLDLKRYLRFEDTPYLPGVLDKIRLQANKDIKEYGFAQLRLVIVFFHWHNLKEEKERRIESPLLLLPVTLRKKKGIADAYYLRAETHEAEVNPVLKHQLKELYDLDLPDSIDLESADLLQFYELLQQQIQSSEKAISLDKIDKPRIELIHAKAKQRLHTYRKRARLSGKGVRFMGDLDYSYQSGNFEPLGLQMFLRKVKPPRAPFANFLEDRPAPRLPQMSGGSAVSLPSSPVLEKEQKQYRQKEEEANPYVWGFDMCSLTLANFNYRKMSLVQDYRSFLEDELENPAFDELFSLSPKPLAQAGNQDLDFNESYFIVPSDRSQMNAVLQAREAFSYIIQGPPGTGKSQTITNLIADYAARGKRVLFVCEKRAAIDVVYHRLHQAGLDDLSCLIHDSQADKKAFIMDVKKTYESFIAVDSDEKLISDRQKLSQSLSKGLEDLRDFAKTMTAEDDDSAAPYKVLNNLLELSADRVEIGEKEAEGLPTFSYWQTNLEAVNHLLDTLSEHGFEKNWSEFKYRHLNPVLGKKDQGLSLISDLSESLTKFFGDVIALGELNEDFKERCQSFSDLSELLAFAGECKELAENGLLSLLDGNSHLSRTLRSTFREHKNTQKDLVEARGKTVHWRSRLERRDAETALSQAINFDAGIFRFVMPSYWRLRQIMNSSYNFSAHAIKPRWVDLLRELVEEHKCLESVEKVKEKIAADYGFEDVAATDARLKELRASMTGGLKEWKTFFSSDEKGRDFIQQAVSLHKNWAGIQDQLSQFYHSWRSMNWFGCSELVNEMSDCDRDGLYILAEFNNLDQDVQDSLQQCKLPLASLSWAIANKEFESICRKNKTFDKFNYKKLAKLRDRFARDYKKWQDLNGEFILAETRSRFKRHYQLSETATSQLDESQKAFKKLYRSGRKELEHEFGKSMRYKSIRSLAADETSIVLRDLKPIWLMSPLSVSDTLPLKIDEFDVVIFDEASQIQLEESVPALYRSPQIIVVGDEKQLPPTQFFSGASSEDASVLIEEDGESYEYDLNVDSFLTQSARTLPSTMLMWHYRSRFEKLIAFSNEAFYGGKLLTIPDCSLEKGGQSEIIIGDQLDDIDVEQTVLERSISFHYLEKGLYEKRKNSSEAHYIARLVRSILEKESGLSIGIVAFSEAQQGEIENALGRLATEDSSFKKRYEQELEREEDEQFVGLFVKNLENVQGDERDIIILSVCYGYDRQQKMRMNFGPINKSGGEKRLNVIFSRSKRHMVVVSSIKGHAITNTYNDGANCLRNYLEYSEAVSAADEDKVKLVLSRLYNYGFDELESRQLGLAAEQMYQALSDKGWQVDRNVGKSRFRCDLAIRKRGDSHYRLAILFDNYQEGSVRDTLEDFLLKPIVMGVFDWQYLYFLSKDWFEDPQELITKVEAKLESMNGKIL